MISPELKFEDLVILEPGTILYVHTHTGSLSKYELVTFLKARGANLPNRVYIRNLQTKRCFKYHLNWLQQGLISFYVAVDDL